MQFFARQCIHLLIYVRDCLWVDIGALKATAAYGRCVSAVGLFWLVMNKRCAIESGGVALAMVICVLPVSLQGDFAILVGINHIQPNIGHLLHMCLVHVRWCSSRHNGRNAWLGAFRARPNPFVTAFKTDFFVQDTGCRECLTNTLAWPWGWCVCHRGSEAAKF